MEKKQSSVDYLVEQLFKTRNNSTEVKETNSESIIQRANDMHKNEVKNSHFDGQCLYAKSGTKQISLAENSENYYNQKFGGNNE